MAETRTAHTAATLQGFALVPAAVAAMAITMWVNDDPNASGTQAILMTVFAIVFTIGAALLYRPVLGRGGATTAPPDGPRPERRSAGPW